MSNQGQCHFLTLAQGSLHMKIKTWFSQKPLGHFQQNFICKDYVQGNDAGHMIKVTAMPIYGPNTLKIFFQGTSGVVLMKLGM